MSLIEYNERIPSRRRNNQRLWTAYLGLFRGGSNAFHPLPPNPNVLMYLVPQYEEAIYADEPLAVRRVFFDALELLLTPDTVIVPEVEGMLVSDALITLSNVSLSGTVSFVQEGEPYNTVVTQSIAAGTPVGQGTVIQLQVDNETLVPVLVGLTKEAASAALGVAVLGADPEPIVSAAPVGTVVSQDIMAGTSLIANTVVTFRYAIAGGGFRVQAVTAGWYGNTFYNPGDVFDLLQSSDFSDYTLNYEIDGAEYTTGWMKQVPQSTPLTQNDGSGFLVTMDPNRRFVE
jgi:hypothetical protein